VIEFIAEHYRNRIKQYKRDLKVIRAVRVDARQMPEQCFGGHREVRTDSTRSP